MTPQTRRWIGYITLTVGAALAFYLWCYRADVVVENDVVYEALSHENHLLLDIYHPPGWTWTQHKTILFVHGGGWSTGDKSRFRDMAKDFAHRGYICFSVNYRLATPTSNHYPVQLDDVQYAVRWIRAHSFRYRADTTRIAAIGDSAGGHLAAMLGLMDTRDPDYAPLNQHSSRAQCVIDMYGPTDLTASFPQTPTYPMQKAVDDFLGGPPASVRDVARSASPLFHIDGSAAKFLIFHGILDPTVPVDQSQRFVQALQSKHVPVTYVEFPTEKHDIVQPATRRKFEVLTHEFVDSCLQ